MFHVVLHNIYYNICTMPMAMAEMGRPERSGNDRRPAPSPVETKTMTARTRPQVPGANGNRRHVADEPPQRSPTPPRQPKTKVFSPSPSPPPPATPLHRHGRNPPEISLRVLLPLLIVFERRSSADEVNAIVKAAAKAVGLPDGTVSYYALREGSVDDVWVSMRFLDALRDEGFKRLYGMEKPPPRGHPLWQMWREAGRVTIEKKVLGSIVYPILKYVRCDSYHSLFYSCSPHFSKLYIPFLLIHCLGHLEVQGWSTEICQLLSVKGEYFPNTLCTSYTQEFSSVSY